MNILQAYAGFTGELSKLGMGEWAATLATRLQEYFAAPEHGDFPRWQQALEQLPPLRQRCDSNRNVPRFGEDPDDEVPGHQQQLMNALLGLRPWRKGPMDIGGILIDSEWRCDWKWQRVAPHLSSLQGRTVLDVGCGNGYYSWRLHGAGARCVIGIDPGLLFIMQWLACRHYAGDQPLWLLPTTLEALPPSPVGFDTVLSMGVLYHRRDPLQHLQQLYDQTAAGGELVLETLVTPDHAQELALDRDQRYARMRNVWNIPHVATIQQWLEQAGYAQTRLVDLSVTTTAEQRSTAWMPFDSLAEALDPADQSRTIEGHSAPMRAVFTACRRD
ncbi:MAG: tRNA 5-methoxyuridine(34)/uridine 5-oxyacetic acid(34) synthase CmoB [Wenzhouxiangellaceae bacterium]